MLKQRAVSYIEEHSRFAYELLLELAQIPAPSNQEEKRAEFCKNWLEAQGAQGVQIDEALNVIWSVGDLTAGPIRVFMAHSDVVFPDTQPLPLVVEEGKIKCPGIGDDTANVVALLLAAKYLITYGLQPGEGGVLVVINSGEEGLGNLKGCRRILQTYGDRITEFVTFDGTAYSITERAVGSKRYRVTIRTEGGHSLSNFGNRNAIAYMASLIDTLYTMKVPEGSRSSYNVGTISGGTSVNTIAQHAEMLYEFRSDDREALGTMERHFMAAVELYRTKGIEVEVELIGDRPCSAYVDPQAQKALTDRAVERVERWFGLVPKIGASSTDCNIPLSMGIPSVCVGCVIGKGAHTRQEEVQIDSLIPGYKVCLSMLLHCFQEEKDL